MPMLLTDWILSLADFMSSGSGDSVTAIASLNVDVSSFAGDACCLRHVIRRQGRWLSCAFSIEGARLVGCRCKLEDPAITVCGCGGFQVY